ncbi:CAP domain-containing protein [Alicyclobacillus acidoterrestris]|uniref:CAP domain-containing protein n=1 Tax=Alicyclobacillus acidoterrestris (strain ATCC 49025 / DSM 3922 / CIP 106132 / NCIMB 13137 / GD3B) TaxID=1356854 RepID=T0DF92_ALIAG|nr:CAP domain-containing protein [Alicyclobacillus acidoterrestris]EPZ48291.1 hypothetical protein N007_00800 [Alicyclobacillus acidoterrestris ATCC 49025]UNO50396.1 CAP domain-containing protein [Alicyclobacillus acidoterrestris]
MLKRTIARSVATTLLTVCAASPVFAATSGNSGTSTSKVYTQSFAFTNWGQADNWLQSQLKTYIPSASSQVPVQKAASPSTTQTSVQKSAPAKTTTAQTSASQKTTTPANSSIPTYVSQIVNLVNQQRKQNGLSPLKVNTSLDTMAQTKAQDMINENYFDHTSPKYGSPFNMMSTFGIHYTYAGENIAAGQPDAATVMKDWMNSAGHRANILNPNYTEIGVGEAHGGTYGTYWVQEFIHP